MAIKRTAQSDASGTVSAGAAAVGDRVYLFGLSDTQGLTLTPPSDGQTWTEIDQGSEVGAASSTLAGWWADMVGSVPANFTVGGGTIAATALFIINPNGSTLGTPDAPAMTTSIVGGSGSITSPVLNAGATSYTICAFSADDQSTITTPPALMDEDIGAIGTGCSLALFSAANANDATFSDTLVWSTLGTERMCIGISQPFTVAGPTIDTHPTAGTCVLNNDSRTSKTFTSAATTSGGTLVKRGQFEDSVGSGTYTDLTEGGIWANVATDAVTVTPTTKTGITGRRFRHRYTDDNGTSYSNPVVLTVYNGVILSAASAVTDASGVATITYTTDLPVTANGAFNKFSAVCDGATSRTSGRPA